MGRITEEKIQRIKRAYNADPHFQRVAKKEGVDWRTVKKYGPSGGEETIQVRVGTATTRPRAGGRKAANERSQSLSSQAFKLMKRSLEPVDIAIQLDLTEEDYRNYRRQFLRLINYHNLDRLYEELGGKDEELDAFCRLYRRMKEEGMVKQSTEFVELLKGEWELKNVGNSIAVKRNELREVIGKIEERINYLKSVQIEIKNAEKRRDELRVLNFREDRRLNDTTSELEDWKLALESMNNEERYQDVLDAIAGRIEGIVEKKWLFLITYRTALLVALRSIPDREHLIQNAGERLVDLSPEQKRYTQASLQLDHAVKLQLKELLAREGVFEFGDYFEEFLGDE